MYYELCFIISPAVPETEHARVQRAVADYLQEIKASMVGEPYFLGRRKLAYPINKQKHGFYLFLDFSLPEDKGGLRQLENKLKHNTDILRHLILKKDQPSTATEVAKLIASNKPVVATRRPKKASPTRTRPTTPRVVKKETAVPAAEKNLLSLDDIDKKLDEILTNEPKLD